MKALNVADDTQHVLTFAHICHKDALERRLLLVELPPNLSISCLEFLTSNSGAVRVCMTRTFGTWVRRGLGARTSLNWIAPICPSSCRVSCAASLCTNSCTRFISSLLNCDILQTCAITMKFQSCESDPCCYPPTHPCLTNVKRINPAQML